MTLVQNRCRDRGLSTRLRNRSLALKASTFLLLRADAIRMRAGLRCFCSLLALALQNEIHRLGRCAGRFKDLVLIFPERLK